MSKSASEFIESEIGENLESNQFAALILVFHLCKVLNGNKGCYDRFTSGRRLAHVGSGYDIHVYDARVRPTHDT